ncbi:MAG: DUF3159 domain-containing protein [Pseudonocardiaceae bacterium]
MTRPPIGRRLGGWAGMVSSALPVVVFVVVNTLGSLVVALVVAIGVAMGIVVWRLARRESPRPAIFGLLGVGLGALFAYHTGQAKGFFLFGIWTNALSCGVFTISVLVRWPLVGVVSQWINGGGPGWRADKTLMRTYTLVSLFWAGTFGAKFVLEQLLYNTDQTGWLGFAQIVVTPALTGLALLATFWAVRLNTTAGQST